MHASFVVIAATVTAFAACGASPAPPVAPPPPAPDAECAHAGATVARVLHLDDAHAPALAAVVEHHCRADAWTAAAQACVAAAADHAAALQCAYKHLTEEQHQLVVQDMTPLLPAPPDDSAPVEHGSQAEIAAHADAEGRVLLTQGRAADASERFRDAVARVPEAAYFFDLCKSLHVEGKYAEALSACGAADVNTTDDALRRHIAAESDRIKADAKATTLQQRD